MAVTAVSDPEPSDEGDIVDVVGQYLPLRPASVGQLRGDCPFCDSPAFRVRPAHDTFHGFG